MLQHQIASAQIIGKEVHLLEPRILAVELVAKPCTNAWKSRVVRLLDIKVQQSCVDAFAEEAVCSLLHHIRITVKSRTASSTTLCPNLLLAIDVSTATGSTVLDVTQRAFAPELASHLVALSAIHQELAGEAPMSVTFKPSRQTILVTDFAQTSHIIVGHTVGYQATQIPQETFALVLRADDLTVQDRQPRQGVVAVSLSENGNHVICPVLPAHLIAVFHCSDQALAVFGRDSSENLAHKSIEMVCHMLLAHLVNLQSCCFSRGGAISHSSRKHSSTIDGPFACRHLPFQFAVFLHLSRQVDNLLRLNNQSCFQRFGLRRPHIPIPHRQRALEHFAQRLLFVSLHQWLLTQRHLEACGLSAAVQCQTEILRRYVGNAQADGRQGMEAHIRIVVRTVKMLYAQRLELATDFSLQNGINKQVGGCFEENAPQRHRLVRMNLFRHLGAGLFLYLANERFVRNDRHCHYTGILSILTDNWQIEALQGTVANSFDMLLGQISHALLRLNPWATALAPTWAVKETYLYV